MEHVFTMLHHSSADSAAPTRRSARTATRRRSFTATVAMGAVLAVAGGVALAVTPTTMAVASVNPVAAISAATAGAMDPGAQALDSITADTREALSRASISLAIAEATEGQAEASGVDFGTAGYDIDTADLAAAVDALDGFEMTPMLLLPERTENVVAATEKVSAAVTELRDRLTAAYEKRAAERAAAAAAAAAEAQRLAEEAAAAALAAANTPEGARATAAAMLGQYGWGSDQFSCLSNLWEKESNWNYQAYNASSGATGIPQSLPGNKMATAGADWQTNAATQIRWGLDYIDRAYGSPCAAWGHSQATNWY